MDEDHSILERLEATRSHQCRRSVFAGLGHPSFVPSSTVTTYSDVQNHSSARTIQPP